MNLTQEQLQEMIGIFVRELDIYGYKAISMSKSKLKVKKLGTSDYFTLDVETYKIAFHTQKKNKPVKDKLRALELQLHLEDVVLKPFGISNVE